jgi:hypothetical protein
MRTRLSSSMLLRGLTLVSLLMGLLLPISARAVAPLDANDATFFRRLTIGLLHSGKSPADVMDYVVNLRLCALSSISDGSKLEECMKLYTTKMGIPVYQAIDYAGLIGYFSVYDGFLKTAGPMVVSNASGGLRGVRTDPQGKEARFDFYPAGRDYVDFDYNTDVDHGTGYLYWVTDCMLVGIFRSFQLQDTPGQFNSGVVVFRRCGFA